MLPTRVDSSNGKGSTMAKIGLFYGSSTSRTEYVASDIHDAIEAQLGADTVDIFDIGLTDVSEMLKYDYLILGIPTWDIGQLQADWDIKLPDLEDIDLKGRKVAIFALGDQYGYPDTFLDAAGILAETVLALDGELVGYTPTTGYEFQYSLFVDGDQFMGLALDEDQQPNLTKARIEAWIKQVLDAFGISHGEAVP